MFCETLGIPRDLRHIGLFQQQNNVGSDQCPSIAAVPLCGRSRPERKYILRQEELTGLLLSFKDYSAMGRKLGKLMGECICLMLAYTS